MSFEKILIVEDDLVIRNLLQGIFQRHKLPVTLADNLAQAQTCLAKEPFDLMMLDLRLPDGDGLKFLEQVNTLPERPLVVMVTGFGSIESAVACMRAGAFDYVLKPFSPSQIDVILRKAQTYRQLVKVNSLLSDDPEFIDYTHYAKIANYLKDLTIEVGIGPRPRMNGSANSSSNSCHGPFTSRPIGSP